MASGELVGPLILFVICRDFPAGRVLKVRLPGFSPNGQSDGELWIANKSTGEESEHVNAHYFGTVLPAALKERDKRVVKTAQAALKDLQDTVKEVKRMLAELEGEAAKGEDEEAHSEKKKAARMKPKAQAVRKKAKTTPITVRGSGRKRNCEKQSAAKRKT